MIVSYNLDEQKDFLEKGLKFKKILFISLKILGGPKDTLAPPHSDFLGGHGPPGPPSSSTPDGYPH
jgi:hypothetical protein